MKHEIEVENIRCGGCANTITKKLLETDGVDTVEVKIEEQIVIVDTADDAGKQAAIDRLAKLGYPLKGSVEGIEALKGKAKSVVSCAIGKVS